MILKISRREFFNFIQNFLLMGHIKTGSILFLECRRIFRTNYFFASYWLLFRNFKPIIVRGNHIGIEAHSSRVSFQGLPIWFHLLHWLIKRINEQKVFLIQEIAILFPWIPRCFCCWRRIFIKTIFLANWFLHSFIKFVVKKILTFNPLGGLYTKCFPKELFWRFT